MSSYARVIGGVAVVLLLTSVASAGLIAYNDFGGTANGVFAGGNTTAFTGTTGGTLKDYNTGASTGITMTLSTASGYWFRDEGAMAVGTPAYTVFNGKVNVLGHIGNTSPYTITLTGLNLSDTYDIVLFGNRDYPNATETNAYTISDTETASSFTNISSGTISGTNNETATMNNGDNALTGYVAHFTDIKSGSDGDFTITLSSSTYWRLNAMRLEATPEPMTLSLLAVGGIGVLLRRRLTK